ncbi:hypothetical protein NEMBOFW57_009007 [Staphylotrichum longicolle]|uniref:F-box domain-containing protein n=1 Tax=Staphylotrichum longicolle TaxID=669026 RepID=A0AAD4HX60_9PEZI|nr:hypothetical protein NEMBOFW57_009007 [Staphylotrichum longicolle]
MSPLGLVSAAPTAAERELSETADNELRGPDENLHVADESRGSLRTLNILDLPDELLLGIFELVEGPDFDSPLRRSRCFRTDDAFPISKQDIKNARLVCRRFCDISSQLLVRFVRVDLNELSLARLDEIARHPIISKGVRLVKIILHFYNRQFEHRNAFIAYHADMVEEHVPLIKTFRAWKHGLSDQVVASMSAERKALADDLHWLIDADPHDDGAWTEDKHACRLRVEQIHREYLGLRAAQQSLVRSGKFSQVLGSAIARMPGARRLGFADVGYTIQKVHRLSEPGTELWSGLRHVMLQPMGCDEVARHGLELPDYGCIAGMIDAVRSAGGFLNGTHIYLTQPGSLVLAPDMREAFSSGLRQLKEFSFECVNIPDEPDADEVSQFLAAFDIDLSKLALLLERLPESMVHLALEDVSLRAGTWKDALDALRAKKSIRKELSRPHAAECDNMSSEDYQRIFSRAEQNPYVSKAELYIRNSIFQTHNPLQLLEDRLAIEAGE